MNVYNNRSLNGLLNLNLDNLYINNELNTSALSYNEFYTLSGIITTTTIQNQINTSNFSINNSKIDITLLQNYYNGLRYFLDEINYLNIKTTGIEHTISSYITTINNKLNVNYIDTGYNDITREINSGNIIYGGGNYQNALNIYGKGPSLNQRQINLFDNVQIFGNLIVNGNSNLSSLSGIISTSTIFGISTVSQLPYGNLPTVSIDNSVPSNPKLLFGIPQGKDGTNGSNGGQGGKGDKGDKGNPGDSTVASTAAGAAAASALAAGGAAFAAAGSATTAATAATSAATNAATCETLFQEIAPKVRNIETKTTHLTRTYIKGDLLLTDGLSNQVQLSNQPNAKSHFFNSVQVNGKLYTNYVEVDAEGPSTLWIGNENNNKLNLRSKEEINIIGISKVYINSQGEIVIESPTSITLRAPSIIIEGEMKNTNVTGLNLGNYFSSLSNSISTSNVNGFIRQGFSNVQTFTL